VIIVERLTQYASWVHSLNDARAKAKISLRIDRLALGNQATLSPSATA
jgi:putative component of toxin-antitoxin plasmid stabilization module